MGDVKVYRMNDYEWWASDLSIEETSEFYTKKIGEENDLEGIIECDIDKEGMWWELDSGTTERKEALLRLDGADSWSQGIERVSGDLINERGSISKWISFRDAIKRSGEYTEPFCIASTEW